MNYGYVRVSTKEQNIDRQMEDMYNQGLTDDCIFIDKQSGKDFDRTNYQKMKALFKDGDLLIIKSIDRLGRNYDMIIEEWKDIVNRLNKDKPKESDLPNCKENIWEDLNIHSQQIFMKYCHNIKTNLSLYQKL